MSEVETKSSRTVQVPVFNGKKNQFGIWYPRFKAYCVAKGIHEALENSFALPADPKAVPTAEEAKKEHQDKISKNAAASAALTLAFTTATLMDIVTSTESTQEELSTKQLKNCYASTVHKITSQKWKLRLNSVDSNLIQVRTRRKFSCN